MKNRPLNAKTNRKKGIRPGESSSSNPTVTIHRDAVRAYRKKHAKSLTFNVSSRVMLADTEIAAVNGQDSGKLLISPAGVFIGLHSQPPPLQKCINAALESCSDILREQLPENLADSFCAYFAALLPLLESARELATSLARCNDEEVRLEKLLQVTGIVYPISAVARRVPAAVIQRSWSALAKAVHEMLPIAQLVVSEKSHHDSDSECENDHPEENFSLNVITGVLLLRSLLTVLSRLLYIRATLMMPTGNAEPEDWRSPNGISANLFAALFHFVFHQKPKVRRIAHAAIVRIVSNPSVASSSIIVKQTADLVVSATKRASNASETNEVMLRRCLALIKDVAPYLPSTTIKPMAELLLRLTVLGSQTVRLLSYSGLAACCANDVGSVQEESSVSFAESLAAALMSDFRPPGLNQAANMSHVLTAVYAEWLRCVQVAHMAVLQRNPIKALVALPRLIETIFHIFTATTTSLQASFVAQDQIAGSNEQKKLVALAADLLQTWIGALAHLARKFKPNSAEFSAVASAVESLTSVLEKSLGFEHHQAWPQILHFIAHVIKQLGSNLPAVESMTRGLLPVLSELQFNASNRLATSTPETSIKLLLSAIDEVFGASIAALGPEFVVSAVQFLEFSPETINNLRKSDVDAASWLLSLLGRFSGESCPESQAGNRLLYFIKKLLPLQALLSSAIAANNSQCPSIFLSLLYSRVWSTLPAFCMTWSDASPIVVPSDFAKILGDRLTNDVAIRPFILNALRRLVENAPLQIAKYAKNFLPILFNLHVNQAEQQNENTFSNFAAEDDGLVIQTVRLWLSRHDAITLELAEHFLDRTWTRLSDALTKLKNVVSDTRMNEDETEVQQASIVSLPPLLLDLCIAMMGRFSPSFIRNFIIVAKRDTAIELLTARQFSGLQKRAYRLIEDAIEIVVIQNSPSRGGHLSAEEKLAFIRGEVQPLLAEVLSKTAAPARRARLNCLLVFAKAALLTSKQPDSNSFYSTLLWEAIASLVDLNVRARMAAVKLLVFIASAMILPGSAHALCYPENDGHNQSKITSMSDNNEGDDDENATCRLESLLRLLLDRLPTASQWSPYQSHSTVESCCAILTAIGRIFRQFRNPLIHENVTLVLDRAEPLLAGAHASAFRRVVRCVLMIISNAISALPGSELECLLSRLMPIVSGCTFPEAHRKPLRTSFERLLVKLARKCGGPLVASLLSGLRQNERGSEDKRLRHLFRTLNKACSAWSKRHFESNSNVAGSESEMSEEDEEAPGVKPIDRLKNKRPGMNLVENVDDIADASAPGSALRLAAKQHGLLTAKMQGKKPESSLSKAGKIVVRKPRKSQDFSDDDDEEPEFDSDRDGSSDDYRGSDDDDSDVDKKRRQKNKKSKPVSKTIGKKTSKEVRKQMMSAKKGQKMQPYSYKPLQRHVLNKRRSVQFRDRKYK